MLHGGGSIREDPVVAGDIAVYRDLVAEPLGARPVTANQVGDARLVLVCGPGPDPFMVARLARDPDRRIVVIGAMDNDAISYYEAGALYVVPPDASLEEIRAALEKARSGESLEPSPRHTRLMFDRVRRRHSVPDAVGVPALTPRELEVARLLSLPDKEIARRLSIASSTVKKHTNRILRKLGVQSRHDVAGRLRL